MILKPVRTVKSANIQRVDPTSPLCRTVTAVLGRIGDKWTVLIIVLLGDGPRRFNEIKRLVNGISQRMLTLTLRGLERDGLVSRTVTSTTPPRVDYALTRLGHSLWNALAPVGSWAQKHVSEIVTAQESFDQRQRKRA